MIIYKLTMPDNYTNMKTAIEAYRNSRSRPVVFCRTIDRYGKPCIELSLTDKESCFDAIKKGFTGSLDIKDVPVTRIWTSRNDKSRIAPTGTPSRSQLEERDDAPAKVTINRILELIRQNGVQKVANDTVKGRYDIVIEGTEEFLLTGNNLSDILEYISLVKSEETRRDIYKSLISSMS